MFHQKSINPSASKRDCQISASLSRKYVQFVEFLNSLNRIFIRGNVLKIFLIFFRKPVEHILPVFIFPLVTYPPIPLPQRLSAALFPKLQVVNLAQNELSDWREFVVLGALPHLHTLGMRPQIRNMTAIPS